MTVLQELRTLSGDPQAYARTAIGLLKPKQRLDVVLAALLALTEMPAPQAREPLLRLYCHYAANGPKRDPGAHTRRAILDALRPVALPDDVPLLFDAVATYEFLPPDFKEDAVLLRSGALLILNELDRSLARFHAARLLVDRYTEKMSAEPALTAVRVLHSQDELLPLYQLAMSAAGSNLPDVISECLRCLTRIPEELVPSLIERYGESKDGVILVGLYEFLIGHHAGPQALDFLATSLASQTDFDVYRYLVITLLSSRQPILISLVSNTAHFETDSKRIAILLEAAELFSTDPDIADLVQQLRADRT